MDLEQLSARLGELAKQKKGIEDEMNKTILASPDGSAALAGGCLRLEDVYCTRGERKYGPYGPYYYLYLHHTSKMEKRYLGKQADRLVPKIEDRARLDELERQYKRILSLERRLTKLLSALHS